jgi:DNA-binding CsgD family transcriptional regulator
MSKPKNSEGTRRKGNAKQLRDQTITALAMDGKSGIEIAKEVGVTPQTVSEVLNSDEVKAISKRRQEAIRNLGDLSIQVMTDALNARFDETPGAMSTALKAATLINKTLGLITEKVDLQHSFPKPTIIERSDGSSEVLGASDEDEE